jgi:ribosomal protein S18 acetylase RimI-like enzyme
VVNVRTAAVADGAALRRLASLARTSTVSARPFTPADGARLDVALSRPDVQVLLAEAPDPADLPVGLLVLRRGELLPLSGSEAAHVEQLWVQPEHRRRGIARALLKAATAHAQQSGLDEVTCTAPPADRDAQRFLARLGFAPLVTRRVVSVSALRRRLGCVEPTAVRRSALEQLLERRRREHRRRVPDPSTT